MKLRCAHGIGMAALALVASLGCHKFSRDNSKVIANVAGEKITEKSFAETIKAMVPDEAKAKDILSSEALHDKRNEFLGQIAKAKALVLLGKAQGLDKDPAVKLRLESLLYQESGDIRNSIQELRRYFDQIIDEVRRISNNLLPSVLEAFSIPTRSAGYTAITIQSLYRFIISNISHLGSMFAQGIQFELHEITDIHRQVVSLERGPDFISQDFID